jgi:hypothetical protein
MDADNHWQDLLTMKVRPTTDVLVSRLGEEIVMLDLASERYFGLDSVGAAVWEALGTAPNAAAAVDTLLSRYAVDRETLTRDVWRLIARLKEKGLVEVADAASA